MGYQPLEDLLPKADYSVYKLIRLASLRATELADGLPKLIDAPATMKISTMALEEIRAGRVVLAETVEDNPPPPGTVKVEKQEKQTEEESESEGEEEPEGEKTEESEKGDEPEE